ncbi:hypothetical protein CEXT_222401 [Caerostris extrusa]|uniref:Uncharacterized protein n=1 Tax=Caerostris extrusa TaxID=172846 RepID=A0AAV4V7P5_CAEEX|nr:hypothetical protein CEXT_222401 [Caerostris extrusa]
MTREKKICNHENKIQGVYVEGGVERIFCFIGVRIIQYISVARVGRMETDADNTIRERKREKKRRSSEEKKRKKSKTMHLRGWTFPKSVRVRRDPAVTTPIFSPLEGRPPMARLMTSRDPQNGRGKTKSIKRRSIPGSVSVVVDPSPQRSRSVVSSSEI